MTTVFLTKALAPGCAGALATVAALAAFGAAVLAGAMAMAAAAAADGGASAEPASARVEARSADLLAVGLVRGDRMTLRLSRTIDNAPVADAAVTVVLRGVAHPATVETDGSYTVQTEDLKLPGAAVIDIQVVRSASRQSLKGTLQVAAAEDSPDDKNNARQLWWWVLNFAVCIGFLWLISRRRKAAQD